MSAVTADGPATMPDMTLDRVVDFWAELRPGADCLIDAHRTWSYRDAAGMTGAVAARLALSGIFPGDRVCVMTRPCADFAFSLLGTLRAGAIWVGLNPKHTPREVDHVLDDAQPRLLLIEPAVSASSGARHAAEAAAARGIEVAPLDAFVADAMHASPVRHEMLSPDADAFLVYTSGTTGAPKGAIISHRAPLVVGTEMHRHLGVGAPRVLNNFPCNHIGGVSEITLSTLIAGGAVVFQPRFDPRESFELIARHQVSLLIQVPTMLRLAMDDPALGSADLSSIEVIAFGGSAPTTDLVAALRSVCPRLSNTYGMTETAGGMTWTDLDADDDTQASTVGRPPERFEMRIAGDDGREVQSGVVGELQFRGDYLFSGYWGRADATAAAFTSHGWLRTGDLGYLDENGALVLTGRRSQMYKSGGYNVYPLEIEQWLTSHDSIIEAVVVGVADDTFGEVGSAYVEFAAGSALSGRELKEFCAIALANYKIPKRFEPIHKWPTLPNGKIDRAALANAATTA